MEKLCNNCGSTAKVLNDYFIQRHKAPCGAVCMAGAQNGEGYSHEEKYHESPFDGPPKTDGHYHGECPNRCFVNCCNPPGNLCGPSCFQCFGCNNCGYIHPFEECKNVPRGT